MPEAGDLTRISEHERRGHMAKPYDICEKNLRREVVDSCLVMREEAVEGRLVNWGEVVTR